MPVATIPGGIQFALNPTEELLARQALAAASAGKTFNVFTTMTTPPVAGDYNLYNVSPASGKGVNLPGGADALVFYGSNTALLRGAGGSSEILVGNAGNDTINALGGSGSIFAGDGANNIQLNNSGGAGGAEVIYTGTGADTIRMWGGSVFITGQGSDYVNVNGAANTVVGLTALNVTISDDGANVVDVTGASTVNVLGHGTNDTISTGSSGGAAINFGPGGAGNAVTLDGHAGDTVNIYSGSNTITATGDESFNVTRANNTLNLDGGTHVIGAFKTTINLSDGGADTVTGPATVNITDGQAYTVVLSGNDTISFGSGNDTIVEKGTATISSGPGGVTVTGGSGAQSVAAGAGSSTLIGGSGSDTFVGGSSGSGALDSLVGGTVKNLFIGNGGAGDTMVANLSATTNTFTFNASQAGGAGASYVIQNFVHGSADHIKLVGYGAGAYTETVTGGNTVITLNTGATITLVGYTNFHANDIKLSN